MSPVHGAAVQREFARVVMRYCKQFRSAIDGGAHIGTWSVVLAERFGTVYAFEPVVENHTCLQDNVRQCPNVVSTLAALGAYCGYVETMLPEHQNSGCWYVRKCPLTECDAAMSTIDSLNLSDVDLIKLDVEGAEGFALQGAVTTMARSKPVVVFEDNGLGVKHYGDNWVDPKVILDARGYVQRLRYRKNEIWTSR